MWPLVKEKCKRDDFPYNNLLEVGTNDGRGGAARPKQRVHLLTRRPRIPLNPPTYKPIEFRVRPYGEKGFKTEELLRGGSLSEGDS